MAQNASGGKQGSDAFLPPAFKGKTELLVATEGDDCNPTCSTRRRVFENLKEEKSLLEARKTDLNRQLDLEKRRLEAHNLLESSLKPSVSDPCCWLSHPNEISRMRDRLKKASENEQLILPIVEEVRDIRERLLEQALVVYREDHGPDNGNACSPGQPSSRKSC
eukprot:gb/GEZJ01004446.1/.p1 GENE.gb/GEZJ01004446.1/~~gb/GEZJ01004446.1/.p1  ORF type:complete len:164 (+),score=30.24 gb/GEZJ01004446.1/:2550-3041(+)